MTACPAGFMNWWRKLAMRQENGGCASLQLSAEQAGKICLIILFLFFGLFFLGDILIINVVVENP